jgi:hypothetical protein
VALLEQRCIDAHGFADAGHTQDERARLARRRTWNDALVQRQEAVEHDRQPVAARFEREAELTGLVGDRRQRRPRRIGNGGDGCSR